MTTGSSQAFAGSTSDTSACMATIDHLVNEMTAGRAYIQFHTDDMVDPQNTGPGDLAEPGEIRGDVTADHHNHGKFVAMADKTQNVFAHGTDHSAWNNVAANADITLDVIDSGHHKMVEFSFNVTGLTNVVGIHMHNAAPGNSSTTHLVNFLTDSGSLISGVDGGPITSMDGTYTGTITDADVCSVSHDHGHGSMIGTPTITNPTDASEIIPTHTISGIADPGVFVEVFSSTASIGTVVSDSTGNWSLLATAPLVAGTHVLTATATDGHGNSSGPSAGITVTVIDRLGTISGTVFVDSNGNGAQDAGESGISTTVIAVHSANPEVILLTSTDAEGMYSFPDLIPGYYLIQVTIPKSHVTSPGSDYFSRHTVSADQSVTANFALQMIDTASASSVSGTAFSDSNGNGAQDAGEFGVQGVAIIAINLLTLETSETTTDADGNYYITGMPPGVTLIQTKALPINYLMVDGFDFFSYETLAESVTTVDFPLNEITAEETATVTGIIHEDDNGNGLHDPGEAGFRGVSVYAIELSSGRLLETVTNVRGIYEFTGLVPDTVLIQTGLIPADHLPQIGYATFMYKQLNTGESTTVNFPMRHIYSLDTSTVTGVVYHDANSNGVREHGESGLPGILVTTVALTTGQHESRFTDADGNFTITGVMPDTVLIQSATPAGFTPSTSNGGFEYHMLNDGQTKTVMFGFASSHSRH